MTNATIKGGHTSNAARRHHLHQHNQGKDQRPTSKRIDAEQADTVALQEIGRACANMTKRFGTQQSSQDRTLKQPH